MKKYLTSVISLFVLTVFLYSETTTALEQDSVRVYELKEVVATGTKNPTDSRLLPLTVSVVKQEQLEERHEQNILPTLMQTVPGLFVTQRGVMGYGVSTGGSGAISVRGIGSSPNTGMLVLIDGLPQYAGLYGHPIADNYQTMMTERVEVIRGPASLFYGSNAMGGVVNIVTRQPKQDTVLTNVHLQGGSYYSLETGITNQVRRGKFSSAVGFDYSRTDGHRRNMNFDEYNAFVRLGYDISLNWRMSAMGNVAYFNSSNPGTVSNPLEDNDMHVLRGTASLSVENEYKRTSGAIRLYYNGGRHKIDEGYQQDAEPQTKFYLHNDLMAGVSVYQTVAMFRGNRTTFGFDYQHFGGHAWNQSKEIKGKVGQTDIIRKTQVELAGYVDFRQEVVSWFSLEAGIRFDWHSGAGMNYIPQAGLSFVLPKETELKALVSRGFRSPTIREMYMYKPANEELRAESLWNYELSWRHRVSTFSYGANLFYIKGDNMIQTVTIDGNPRNVNTGEIKNYGAEVEAQYRINRYWSLNTNHAYLHMDNKVVAAPEYKGFLGVDYRCEQLTVNGGLQYVNSLYTAVGNAEQKENFFLLNLAVTYALTSHVSLWARGENLLAQHYEMNLSYPMPRATFMGGVNIYF